MIATASLAVAMLAFVGSHFALSHPYRRTLVGHFGEAGFAGLYGIVAALTLLWVIVSWRTADNSMPVWIAPGWWWIVASGLMLVASILLAGSLVRNPAFPHPGAQKAPVRAATGVFAVTRHPMNMAFALWALVHLSLWWSARNLIVAAGILVLAVGGSIGQDVKKRAVQGQSWRAWEQRTSLLPFAALLEGRAKWKDAAPGWIALGGGLVFWLLVTAFHATTVSPLAWIYQNG
jgi:uncharacterized membrane protein